MLERRMAGCTLQETAAKMNLSTSAVFARCRRLGLELAERAGIEVRVKRNNPRTDAPISTVGATVAAVLDRAA